MKTIRFPDGQPGLEIQTFHEVARALTSSVDLTGILNGILQQMTKFFSPQAWSLLIVDEKNRQLYYGVISGGQTEKLRHKRIPLGQGIPGWVALHGEPMILASVPEDQELSDELPENSGRVESIICLPLRVRNKTYGVLQLVNCHPENMDNHEIFFLHALCDYAAIAVQNARAFEQIQQLTITDDCTGLFNARHLYERLEHSLERSRRSGKPVSLIFFDLDHFKMVNDTYGHLRGSRLLAEIGDMVRNSLGLIETGYRYGGDEFVVLMPHQSKQRALDLANRLMDKLRTTTFLPESDIHLRILASFGVSSFPEDGLDIHAVIRAADAAMYHVKNTTRNGVAAAGQFPTGAPE
ncbi:MAG: sensor domain-containing diguanylate cyclase [Acidobacteriaceae bacterium]